MKDDKNKNFIKKTRGLILIWVIALPLSLMLYSTFERTSITILAFAIVASVFVAILFPSKNIFSKQHKKTDIVTKPFAPSMDIKDEENYKQFLKRTRGILSIWIIAAPLSLIFYSNSEKTSATILTFALLATAFVAFLFPNKHLQTKTSQMPFGPSMDQFIWKFMITWSGTFLIVIGNVLAFGVMVYFANKSMGAAMLVNKYIFFIMICSWVILGCGRWYIGKYYPDDYKDM